MPGEERAAIRGTQSLVHTLTACWKRPSLTALEIAWRWVFGVPALILLWHEGTRIVRDSSLDVGSLGRMTVTNPVAAAATLSEAAGAVMPGVLRAAEWLGPVLLVAWIVFSALGRSAVLRRVDASLTRRPVTLMELHAARIVFLAGSFAAWLCCLRAIARATVTGPLSSGGEPNLVLYCALVIVTTLGMFALWAVVSWVLSVAPLLAMLRNLGAWESLKAALRVGPLGGKLVEINLVMGIVKIMLIVLAMAFSACPLPFTSVATPDFMLHWYAFVTLLYLVASDFFHVVRLMAYLALWKAYAARS